MPGRRSALQWRKLARQNSLRGRAARPLTTLLGVLAAVLLPSFLRCVQLKHLHGLLRREVLLLEFVQRAPYYCLGIENPVEVAVPSLYIRQ